MITSIIFLLFFNFYPSQYSNHPQPTNTVQEELIFAKIDTTIVDSQLLIEGKFYNKTDSSFQINYKMVTKKIGGSGISKSAQSGSYLSKPSSEILLNKLGLNIDENMSYEITLGVFSNNKQIAQDSLFYNISD